MTPASLNRPQRPRALKAWWTALFGPRLGALSANSRATDPPPAMSDHEPTLPSLPPPALPPAKDKAKKKKKKKLKKNKDVPKDVKGSDDGLGLDSLMAELKLELEDIDGLDDITAALDDLGQLVGVAKPKLKKKKKKLKLPLPLALTEVGVDTTTSLPSLEDPDPTVSINLNVSTTANTTTDDMATAQDVLADVSVDKLVDTSSSDVKENKQQSETKPTETDSKPTPVSSSTNTTGAGATLGSSAATKFDLDLFSVESDATAATTESALEKIAREEKELAESTYDELVKDAELITGSTDPVVSLNTSEEAPDSRREFQRQVAVDDYKEAKYEADQLLGHSSGDDKLATDSTTPKATTTTITDKDDIPITDKASNPEPTSTTTKEITLEVKEGAQPTEVSDIVDGSERSAQGEPSSSTTDHKPVASDMATPSSTGNDKDVKPQSDAKPKLATPSKPKLKKSKATTDTTTPASAKDQAVLELGENLHYYKDYEHHLSEIDSLKSLRIDTTAVNAYLSAANKEKQTTLTKGDDLEAEAPQSEVVESKADVLDSDDTKPEETEEPIVDNVKSKDVVVDDAQLEEPEEPVTKPKETEDVLTPQEPLEDTVEGLNLSNKSVEGEATQSKSVAAAADTSLDIDDLINELQGEDVDALLRELDADEKSTQARSILKPLGTAAAGGAATTAKQPAKDDDDLDFEVSQDEIRKHLASLPIYLYTSLAGGMQIVPRTNRLALILQANDIKFEYKDLGTDAEAKKIWKRYANGPNGMRTIPGVVRGDEVIGDWKEIDDANEEYKVRELIYETL